MNRRGLTLILQVIVLLFSVTLFAACNAINEQVAEISTQTAAAVLDVTPTSDGVIVPTEVTLSAEPQQEETSTPLPSPSPAIVNTPTVFVPPAPPPTSTPAPTLAPPPTPCPYDGRYAALYSIHGTELGCFRKSAVVGGTGLAQPFIGGWMYWDSVTGRVYALSDNRISAVYDTSTWPVADPNGFSCPDAQATNIRGVFSQAWCEIGQVSLMLGPATDVAELTTIEVEQFTYGSILQEGGDMFLLFDGVWREVIGEPIEQTNFDFQTATAQAKKAGETATASAAAAATETSANATATAGAAATSSAAIAGQTATAAAAPTATVAPSETTVPTNTATATATVDAAATAASNQTATAVGITATAAVNATNTVSACQTATLVAVTATADAAATASAPIPTVDASDPTCP